jgi:hypothetical protein
MRSPAELFAVMSYGVSCIQSESETF